MFAEACQLNDTRFRTSHNVELSHPRGVKEEIDLNNPERRPFRNLGALELDSPQSALQAMRASRCMEVNTVLCQ